MVDDEHETEDLVQFLRLVCVLGILEERHEDIELPIVVQLALLLIYFVNFQDRGRLEGSQAIFHEG